MKENCKDTGGQPTNPTTPSKDRESIDRPATTSHFKVTRDSALPEPRSRMMMELHLMLMISISS